MPDNDRIVELIQLDLDREATEQERAELNQILAASPEAREAHRAFSDVVAGLDAIPMAEAPALRGPILQRLRGATAAPTSNIAAFRPRRRVVVAAVYAVAAAIVVAVAIDRLAERREHAVAPDQAAAAMAGLGPGGWPAVGTFSFPTATLVIRRQGDRYAVQPAGGGSGPLTIAWDTEKLLLSEVVPRRNTRFDAGQATFSQRSQPATVVFRRREGASGSAAVRLLVEGKEIGRATINF